MAKWKRCGLQNRHCAGSIPAPASGKMNPEAFTENLPKAGLVCNGVAIAALFVAKLISVSNNSEAAWGLGAIYTAFTLAAVAMTFIDVGVIVGAHSKGYKIIDGNESIFSDRSVNLLATAVNVFLGMINKLVVVNPPF